MESKQKSIDTNEGIVKKPAFEARKISFVKGENDHTSCYYNEDIELLRVNEGAIKAKANGSTTFIDMNDILIVGEGIIHSFIATTDASVQIVSFPASLFDPLGSEEGPIRELFHSSIFSMNKILSTSNLGKKTNDAFETSYSAITDERPEAQILSLNCLSDLFLLLIKAYSNKIVPQPKESLGTKKLKIMMKYVDENIASSITLNDLAKLVKVSPREAMRLFKGEMEQSPIQYVMSKKLEKGLELILLDPSAPIASIAKKVGFSSPSYFTELFTREYKAKPSEISTKRNITKWTEDPFGSLNKFFGG